MVDYVFDIAICHMRLPVSSFFNIIKWTEVAQHLTGLAPLEVCTYINELISYHLHMLKQLKITDYLQNRNIILNSFPSMQHCC